MLDFIKHIFVLNSLNFNDNATATEIYSFRSSEPDIHVNLNLVIKDEVLLELNDSCAVAIEKFKNSNVTPRELKSFEKYLNQKIAEYLTRSKQTNGNQQNTNYELTSNLLLTKLNN